MACSYKVYRWPVASTNGGTKANQNAYAINFPSSSLYEWLVVMAVLIAVSFVVSSAINQHSDDLYSRFQHSLRKYQHPSLLEENTEIELTNVKILVCGMGRVGSGAYDQLNENNNIIGLDFDKQIVKSQLNGGRKTYYADVSGSDFWSQIDIQNSTIDWILLCAPNVDANKAAAKLARHWGFKGNISATYSINGLHQ